MNDIQSRRRDDIFLVVSHDKLTNKIIIKFLNDAAVTTLKCIPEIAIGESLLTFLAPPTRTIIEDFLNHDSEWKGLGDVVSRISNFYLLTSANEKIRVRIKAFPKESTDMNLLEFELFIRNLTIFDQFTEFKIQNDLLYEKIDPTFDVTNYDSKLNELSLVIPFACKNSIDCVICQIGFEEQDDLYDPSSIIKEVIAILKTKIRDDDKIGIIEHNKIIFILFGCPPSEAETVIERLYSSIRIKINTKFSISYFPITESVPLENVLNSLEKTGKMLLK